MCEHIVKNLAADGEGATRLITCTVGEAPDKQTARLLAKSVVTSSLVKTAIFGADANWGRILCALGYAGAEVSFDQTSVYLASSAGKDVYKRQVFLPGESPPSKTFCRQTANAAGRYGRIGQRQKNR